MSLTRTKDTAIAFIDAKSESDPGKVYEILLFRDKSMKCPCMDFAIYTTKKQEQRGFRTCKHVRGAGQAIRYTGTVEDGWMLGFQPRSEAESLYASVMGIRSVLRIDKGTTQRRRAPIVTGGVVTPVPITPEEETQGLVRSGRTLSSEPTVAPADTQGFVRPRRTIIID